MHIQMGICEKVCRQFISEKYGINLRLEMSGLNINWVEEVPRKKSERQPRPKSEPQPRPKSEQQPTKYRIVHPPTGNVSWV